MRINSPLPLDHFFDHEFHDESSFAKIKERTVALNTLNSYVKKQLPYSLQKQCRVANYRQSILILEVSSASWLTRLRYEQESLISALRQSLLPALASIQYRINPDLITAKSCLQACYEPNSTEVNRVISQNTASLLLTLAQQSPDSLKRKLITLAKHASKSENEH